MNVSFRVIEREMELGIVEDFPVTAIRNTQSEYRMEQFHGGVCNESLKRTSVSNQ